MRSSPTVLAAALVLVSGRGCAREGEPPEAEPPEAAPFPSPAQEPLASVRATEPEPESVIAPYVLELGPRSATIVWRTREESVGELVLVAAAGRTVHREESAARTHRVRLAGLEPDADYRYEVGGLYAGRFRTPASGRAQRFLVFGHPGGTVVPNEFPVELLAARLDALDPDFALCTGDLCYFTTRASFASLFFDRFERFLARKPIYVAPGNHEAGFPLAYGLSYETFRELFPYDYPDEREAYHSFVRGNVRFVAVAYTPLAARSFERQLEWLGTELARDDTEFEVVFLGGAQEPRHFDGDALFEVVVEGGCDVVFGGDGSGAFQDVSRGVPFFFAGTMGPRPHEFYVVDTETWELSVRKYDAAAGPLSGSWRFPTRRAKRTVRDVTALGKPDPEHPSYIYYSELDAPSSTFHGLRVRARNRAEAAVPLWVRWAPAGTPKRGAERFFREQALRLRPGQVGDFLVPLPAVNPMTNEPWVLSELYLRVDEEEVAEGYALQPDILELSLVADEAPGQR